MTSGSSLPNDGEYAVTFHYADLCVTTTFCNREEVASAIDRLLNKREAVGFNAGTGSMILSADGLRYIETNPQLF